MGETSEAENLLDRHRAGDAAARESLISLAERRFVALARAMLRRYPHVRRWEETDDLLQAALVRLNQSLADVRPESLRHFDNLAASQIRRELIDLARRYYGPQGHGAHHHTDGAGPDERLQALSDGSSRPETLEAWAAFHEGVDRLPDEEREVVDLIWYQGMTHAQAAESLGVATKTVQRRWASARLALAESLKDQALPGD